MAERRRAASSPPPMENSPNGAIDAAVRADVIEWLAEILVLDFMADLRVDSSASDNSPTGSNHNETAEVRLV